MDRKEGETEADYQKRMKRNEASRRSKAKKKAAAGESSPTAKSPKAKETKAMKIEEIDSGKMATFFFDMPKTYSLADYEALTKEMGLGRVLADKGTTHIRTQRLGINTWKEVHLRDGKEVGVIERESPYAKQSREAVEEGFASLLARAKAGTLKGEEDEVKYVVLNPKTNDYEYKRAKTVRFIVPIPSYASGMDVVVNRDDPNPPFPEIVIRPAALSVLDVNVLTGASLVSRLEEALDVWRKGTKLKGGMGKMVSMPKSKFIAEHKRLVKILTKGTPSQRKAEAMDQAKELKGGITFYQRIGRMFELYDDQIAELEEVDEEQGGLSREALHSIAQQMRDQNLGPGGRGPRVYGRVRTPPQRDSVSRREGGGLRGGITIPSGATFRLQDDTTNKTFPIFLADTNGTHSFKRTAPTTPVQATMDTEADGFRFIDGGESIDIRYLGIYQGHYFFTTAEGEAYKSSYEKKLERLEDGGEELAKKTFGKGKRSLMLLELFKGTGSVGKVATKMGMDVVSVDLDPYYTPDIETDILKWDYKKWAANNRTPDLIWASPPCNTFSPLAYPLKERDTKTARPKSERARLGTRILYRTLEIIRYFQRKNPNLLYCIENPRGMMRNDAKMKALPHRDTTLYCLYNDKRRKPTDFWNNLEDGLGLKAPDVSKCKETVGVVELPLDKRYAIPSRLVRKILTAMKDEYTGLKGGGLVDETFKPSEGSVVDGLIRVLGDLAHFYANRDPATSLGFRVVRDDLYLNRPILDGKPPLKGDEAHEKTLTYAKQTVLGRNPYTTYFQPTPQQRLSVEVAPLVYEAMKPDNPYQLTPKAGSFGWSVPPRNFGEGVRALSLYPSIKGNTLY